MKKKTNKFKCNMCKKVITDERDMPIKVKVRDHTSTMCINCCYDLNMKLGKEPTT
jgi:hypothetical protein